MKQTLAAGFYKAIFQITRKEIQPLQSTNKNHIYVYWRGYVTLVSRLHVYEVFWNILLIYIFVNNLTL